MYQVNDTVAYSSQGICTVSEICKRDVGGSMVDYYVLKPVADPRSTVYVPVNVILFTSSPRVYFTKEYPSA